MTRTIGDIAIAIGSSLTLSLIVKATIVSGGALIAAAIARRSRAAVRHLLLATAFLVLLVVLPLVSLAVPPWEVKVPIQQPDSTVVGAALAAQDAVVGPSRSAESSPMQTELAANTAPSRLTLVLAAWLAGVTFFLAVMSIGLMRTRRARRDGIPWRDGQAIAAEIATTLSVRRRIQLLLNEAVAGPITCGVVSPAIILPPDARDWNPQDLRRAIVHELEHVRRCDWLMLCIARVVCALYWFHPLVWISLRRLRLDAERACDDAVLRCADAEAYADQLVTLAERVVAARTYAFLAMANRSELAARVSAVLDERQPRGAAGSRWIAASASAALFVLVGIYHAPFTLVDWNGTTTAGLAFALAKGLVLDASLSYLWAQLSYRAKSRWPAVFLHSFHNGVSPWLFPKFFAGGDKTWLGEGGVLPLTCYVVAAIGLSSVVRRQGGR